MTILLTAAILSISFVAVMTSLLFTWREHGVQVSELAQRMRGSRPVGRGHHVVRAPKPRDPVNRWTISIRLPQTRLVAC